MGGPWTPGQEIANLKPGQTYNMLRGETTQQPIGPAKRFDRNIGLPLSKWITSEGGGVDLWDVVNSMKPSIVKGRGYYDYTAKDGRQYLIKGPEDPAMIARDNPAAFTVVMEYAP